MRSSMDCQKVGSSLSAWSGVGVRQGSAYASVLFACICDLQYVRSMDSRVWWVGCCWFRWSTLMIQVSLLAQ